jgi:nitroreductase
MAICKTQSISIPGISYEKDIFTLLENQVDFEKFHTFLSHRRSIRNFNSKPVPKLLIDKIIDAIALAPYGMDAKSISITVINDRKIIEKALPLMAEFYRNIEKWLKNPFIRLMMRKNAGLSAFNTLKDHLLPMIKVGHYDITGGKDNITRNAPALIIFHAPKGTPESVEDAHIRLTYALLAANSLGLGATAIGLVPPAVNKDKRVRSVFEIPENHDALASLILGYPKYHFKNGIIRSGFSVRYLGDAFNDNTNS